jgi:hypothetical protein
VAGYRDERHRQEIQHESILSNPGDKKHWKENGGHLVNFRDWLVANKGSGNKWQETSRVDRDVSAVDTTASAKFHRMPGAHRRNTTSPVKLFTEHPRVFSSTMSGTHSIGQPAEHEPITRPMLGADRKHVIPVKKQRQVD